MTAYRLYTAADEDGMTRVLAEVFARQDPPEVAVGLQPGEFAPFVRLLCPSERRPRGMRDAIAGAPVPSGR